MREDGRLGGKKRIEQPFRREILVYFQVGMDRMDGLPGQFLP